MSDSINPGANRVVPAAYSAFLDHLAVLMRVTTAQAEVVFAELVEAIQGAAGEIDVELLFPDAFEVFVEIYHQVGDTTVAMNEAVSWLELPAEDRILGGKWWIKATMQRPEMQSLAQANARVDPKA